MTALLLPALASGAHADSFLGDGVVVSDVNPRQDFLYALAVDEDALYLAGNDSGSPTSRWRVEKRRLSDGALAPEFGDGGVLTGGPSAEWSRVTALAIDGRHVFLVIETSGKLSIEKRIAYDGRLRKNFGTAGVVALPDENAVWQSANTALVVGKHLLVATDTGRVLKLRTRDGAAAPRFAAAEPPALPRLVTSLAASKSALYLGAATGDGFRFEKRGLQGGRLLWSVDEHFTLVGCGPEAPQAIAVARGTMLVGGMHEGRWRLERRLERDGQLLWTVDLPGSGHCDVVNHVVVTGDEFFAVGARGSRRRIEKRRLTDGALVPGFGAGGVLLGASRVNAARSAAVVCGDLIVGGQLDGNRDQPTNQAWHTARLDTAAGTPVVTTRPACAAAAPQ